MNEWQSLHDSQHKLVVGAFSNYGDLKTKKSVSLTESEVQTFLEEKENQYTRRKTESYVFGGSVLAFLRLRMKIDYVSYRVKHSKRNSISTRAHVLFSITIYFVVSHD